jgi:hypothetical protein
MLDFLKHGTSYRGSQSVLPSISYLGKRLFLPHRASNSALKISPWSESFSEPCWDRAPCFDIEELSWATIGRLFLAFIVQICMTGFQFKLTRLCPRLAFTSLFTCRFTSSISANLPPTDMTHTLAAWHRIQKSAWLMPETQKRLSCCVLEQSGLGRKVAVHRIGHLDDLCQERFVCCRRGPSAALQR